MEQEKMLKNFGERVKDRRVAAHLSQEYVAEVMGYKTRSSIQKIEGGKADVPQSKIYQLAQVLKTSPAYLMGLTTNPRPFDTRLDDFIDKETETDEYGNPNYARLEREMIDITLSDPDTVKLIQNIAVMTPAHKRIICSTAEQLAALDRADTPPNGEYPE